MTSLEGVLYLILHSIEHVSWAGKWTPFCISILGFFVFCVFEIKESVRQVGGRGIRNEGIK
jgi:hypothetical protein